MKLKKMRKALRMVMGRERLGEFEALVVEDAGPPSFDAKIVVGPLAGCVIRVSPEGKPQDYAEWQLETLVQEILNKAGRTECEHLQEVLKVQFSKLSNHLAGMDLT